MTFHRPYARFLVVFFGLLGTNSNACSLHANELSTLAGISSSPLPESMFCGFISCFIIVFNYSYKFVVFCCVFLPLFLCIYCSFKDLDFLSAFLGVLSIWLQIIIRCHLDSVLVFLLISFDLIFIKVLHVAVALFRYCSCIYLVFTISGASFQTTLIGGQFSWSSYQESIGRRHLFDVLPFFFFLFTYTDRVVLRLIVGLPSLSCLM